MKRSYKSLGLFLLASVISTAALINQGKWDEQSQTVAREEESQKLDELEESYYNYVRSEGRADRKFSANRFRNLMIKAGVVLELRHSSEFSETPWSIGTAKD